jgi:hypothetical protein
MTHTKFETMLKNNFIVKEEDLPDPHKSDNPRGLAAIIALSVFLGFMGGLAVFIHF